MIERGVALIVTTASRDGRSIKINDATFSIRAGGKVVEFWDAST